jgi:hypothetical protein
VTIEPTATGSIAVVETTPAFGDELLAGMAHGGDVISGLIPPGLWLSITVYDRRDSRADVADVEIHAIDIPDAQLLNEHLPWAGPVQTYVQPGTHFDHHVWQGIALGRRVRVVGLAPVGRAS